MLYMLMYYTSLHTSIGELFEISLRLALTSVSVSTVTVKQVTVSIKTVFSDNTISSKARVVS